MMVYDDVSLQCCLKPATKALCEVTTISGDLVLEQSFSGSELLGSVRHALREKEPSAQLRLFLGPSEPAEAARSRLSKLTFKPKVH